MKQYILWFPPTICDIKAAAAAGQQVLRSAGSVAGELARK